MSVYSDEMLAVNAQKGDKTAFEELFDRHKKPVLNFIYRMIGSRETAEEVCQEVFIKVYSHIDIYDPKRRFLTWLYTIARNLAKNALRDRKYFRDVSLEKAVHSDNEEITLKDIVADKGPAPRDMLHDKELEDVAKRVLDSMPLKYREAIVMCGTQGMTYKEVADIVGCSVAAVSIRFNKGKKMFMKKFNWYIDGFRKG